MRKTMKSMIKLVAVIMVLQVVLSNLIVSKVEASDKSVILYLSKTGYTNKSVSIQVHIESSIKVKNVLMQKGNISKSSDPSWGDATDITSNRKINVSGNGTYSVKVVDKSGKAVIETITVTNIDKKAPSISLKQENAPGGVKVSVKSSDVSGIKSIKWVKGSIDDAESSQFAKGKDITKGKTFLAPSNGYYSVQVIDKAGNKAVKKIWATTVQPLCDLKPCTGDNYAVKNKIYKDIYGNQFSDGLVMRASSSYMNSTEYINSNFCRMTGTVLVDTSSKDSAEGQLKIYADDMLVQVIPLTKKSMPIKLDIDIEGVTFVRMETTGSLSIYDGGSFQILISDIAFCN